MMRNTKLIPYMGVSALAFLVACEGTIFSPDHDGPGPDPDAIAEELVGAGDRDIREFWPSIDIPFGDNTKMLNFEMMKSEVLRATTLSWVENGEDLWAANRTVLGGADYVGTFIEDRTPSQQKLVTWRKMAFSVCDALVAQEGGQAERVVFDAVDPAAALDTADPAVASQVASLFKRFFYVDPSSTESAESLELLAALAARENAGEAWRGLCSAYLSSMRFLTY